MDERLPPKELARIKRENRIARIRRLRQFVASGAVSLVAVFSGVLLTKGVLAQTSANRPAVVSRVFNLGAKPEQSNHSDDDGDSESAASAPSTSGAPAETAPAPAPAPAPIVTSQS